MNSKNKPFGFLRRNIAFRLWGAMMILAVVGVVFLWVVQIALFEPNYIDASIASINDNMKPLAAELSELPDDDLFSASELLRNFSKSTNVRVYLVDGDGNVLLSYINGKPGAKYNTEEVQKELGYISGSLQAVEQFPYHYFNWEGMDGTRVVAFLPTSYTYDTDPVTINNTWKNRVQIRDLEAFLLPYGYGDGGGGPKNTYVGELYFSAHRGTFTSQAMVKKNNRRCEFALREAEMWSVLASEKGNSYPKEELEQLWKKTLLLQFHDILPGSCIRRVYEEAKPIYEEILAGCRKLIKNAQQSLTKEGCGVTVFNSLGFERKALITLPEEFRNGAIIADKEAVFTMAAEDGIQALVTLPAFGAVSILPAGGAGSGQPDDSGFRETALARVQKKPEGYGLENNLVQVIIDENGEIVSFVLKSSGREFAAEPMNHLQMYKDVPRLFDAWDIDSNYIEQEIEGVHDRSVEVLCESGLKAALKVSGTIGNSSYEQVISLTAESKCVEIAMTIDWREQHRLLKTAFPVSVYAEEGINEIQFGYVKRPTHRSRRYDKERFEVCNHRYSALCDGSHGAAVLNDSKYGISMNSNRLELSLLTAACSPEMRADNGVHMFTYAFTAWEGDFTGSDVVRQAYELNVPPILCSGVTETIRNFKTDRENIILETAKLAEDGSGDFVLRLYECKKAAVKAVVAMPALRGSKAFLCNMLEHEETELTVNEDEMTLDFKAFEVKTVRIKKQDANSEFQ